MGDTSFEVEQNSFHFPCLCVSVTKLGIGEFNEANDLRSEPKELREKSRESEEDEAFRVIGVEEL